MIISIVVEGELRLYEVQGEHVDEWGRLRMHDGLGHEDLARFSLDLASLLKINGTAVHAQPALPPAPTPALPPANPGRTAQLPPRPSLHQVLTVLERHGPMTLDELQRATGVARNVLTMRLGSLRNKKHRARFDGVRWHAIPAGSSPPVAKDDAPQGEQPDLGLAVAAPVARTASGKKSFARPPGAPNLSSREMLDWVRQHPGMTRDEVHRATGLDRVTINNRLFSLGPKSTAGADLRNTVRVDADGRIWPNESEVGAA